MLDLTLTYLNTISYNAQNKELILVPVNNEFTPNETDIENYLQNTYKSALTFWDISLTDPLEIDFERNQTAGLDTELPGIAAYTREMNKIKRTLKKRNDYNPDAYYLFLITKNKKTKYTLNSEHEGHKLAQIFMIYAFCGFLFFRRFLVCRMSKCVKQVLPYLLPAKKILVRRTRGGRGLKLCF